MTSAAPGKPSLVRSTSNLYLVLDSGPLLFEREGGPFVLVEGDVEKQNASAGPWPCLNA